MQIKLTEVEKEMRITEHWNKATTFLTPLEEAKKLILTTNNFLIGGLEIQPWEPRITDLYVMTKFKHQGFASTLLVLAESSLRSQGLQEATLHCYEDRLSFYLERGWYIKSRNLDYSFFLFDSCGSTRKTLYCMGKNLY